jgi:hypothetical protein
MRDFDLSRSAVPRASPRGRHRLDASRDSRSQPGAMSSFADIDRGQRGAPSQLATANILARSHCMFVANDGEPLWFDSKSANSGSRSIDTPMTNGHFVEHELRATPYHCRSSRGSTFPRSSRASAMGETSSIETVADRRGPVSHAASGQDPSPGEARPRSPSRRVRPRRRPSTGTDARAPGARRPCTFANDLGEPSIRMSNDRGMVTPSSHHVLAPPPAEAAIDLQPRPQQRDDQREGRRAARQPLGQPGHEQDNGAQHEHAQLVGVWRKLAHGSRGPSPGRAKLNIASRSTTSTSPARLAVIARGPESIVEVRYPPRDARDPDPPRRGRRQLGGRR